MDADADGEDGNGGGDDIPLTMTASVMLSQLPRDATAALADAGAFPANLKVVVRFKPVGGSAPPLKQELSKISASQRFEFVVLYLRRKLQVAPTDSVFLYVNSTFAPALDEIVGNLHRVRWHPGLSPLTATRACALIISILCSVSRTPTAS